MSPERAIEAATQGLSMAALLLPDPVIPLAVGLVRLAGAAAREIAESGRWTDDDADDLREDARDFFVEHKATRPHAALLTDALVTLVGIAATARREARPLRSHKRRLSGGDGGA